MSTRAAQEHGSEVVLEGRQGRREGRGGWAGEMDIGTILAKWLSTSGEAKSKENFAVFGGALTRRGGTAEAAIPFPGTFQI